MAGLVQTPAIVGSRVELPLLTTLRCNLKCSYCSLGIGDVLGSHRKVTYFLDALDAFIATHLSGHEIYVTFCGGEPTLNLDLMAAVITNTSKSCPERWEDRPRADRASHRHWSGRGRPPAERQGALCRNRM